MTALVVALKHINPRFVIAANFLLQQTICHQTFKFFTFILGPPKNFLSNTGFVVASAAGFTLHHHYLGKLL